jgi:hypothetical protein
MWDPNGSPENEEASAARQYVSKRTAIRTPPVRITIVVVDTNAAGPRGRDEGDGPCDWTGASTECLPDLWHPRA